VDISVLIPAYNAEGTLCRAIDSVLHQTVPVAEIVLVDDGSTDGTAQVVQKYGAPIRYFYYENAGLAVTRNRGIDQAKSEWIAFLDADDEWLPHWVSVQENILKNCPHLMWSCCNYELAGNGVFLKKQSHEIANFSGVVRYFDVRARGLGMATPGFLIRRNVFDEVGMFKPEMRSGQDDDMWERIAMRYPYIGYSSDICWRYWQDNVNRITRTKRPRDLHVKNICKNALLAQSLGQEVREAYYPWGRKRAMNYILLAAAKKIQVRREILDEAKMFFPLTFCERVQEAMLDMLPGPIAGRVVDRLVD